jgi:hypothetical protein
MGTRKELLEYLWSNVINSSLATSGLRNIVANSERRPDDPFADAGAAIKRILAAGGTSEDIALIRRAAAYEAVFGTLYSLEDPGVDENDIFMLHEELLTADPTGMEGRPGSAQSWRVAHGEEN